MLKFEYSNKKMKCRRWFSFKSICSDGRWDGKLKGDVRFKTDVLWIGKGRYFVRIDKHNLFWSVNIIGTEDLGEKFNCDGRDAIRDAVCSVIFKKSGHGYRRILKSTLLPFRVQSRHFLLSIPDRRSSNSCASDGVSCWSLRWSLGSIWWHFIQEAASIVPACQGSWGRPVIPVIRKKECQRTMLRIIVEVLLSAKQSFWNSL